MEHEVFILSLHFFPGHLSGWPLRVIFVKHNKCIPLRYAAEGPSLKVSSHNCEVLIRQLPSSLPLFPACIFFFYSIPGIRNVIYLSSVSIQLKTLEHLCWVVTLFGYAFPLFESKWTCLGKRKAHLPGLHPILFLPTQALPHGKRESSSINLTWGTQPWSAWLRFLLSKSCWL